MNKKFTKVVVWILVGALIVTTFACFGASFIL